MSRSVFFWNSGGTVDGNILPERKAQKRCFMFGDFLCSKFRTGGFHMKQITGNKLLVKALKEEGVEYLFGYPGACTIDISDELYKQDEIKIVLPRHEQALVHEADAYARTTGKVGVCLVTSGPGATNLVTGLATANYDSVPLVCFTGQVPRHLIGNDAFQEVDIVGITRSITKYGVTVRNREDLGRIIKEAFYIARTGKPGPVLIDLPKDVMAEFGSAEYPKNVNIRGYKPNTSVHIGQLKRALKMLSKAKRPLFLAGGGVNIAHAQEVFREVVEKTQVPVVTTVMGRGAISTKHPLFIGNLGMHGAYAANMAVSECDLLFSIGDVDIRKYGSQGQQRTSALSLKLSEIELVRKSISDTPVLLLDDVLSELDSSRQNYLLNNISDTQTIITCTGLDEFVRNRFTVNRVFEVIAGHVYERSI